MRPEDLTSYGGIRPGVLPRRQKRRDLHEVLHRETRLVERGEQIRPHQPRLRLEPVGRIARPVDRDLQAWIDREIFTADGRMEIESATDGGLSLIARFRNNTWGEMRTRWHFTLTPDHTTITRLETGQA